MRDAQGIHVYEESTVVDTFSGFMNEGMKSVSEKFAAIADTQGRWVTFVPTYANLNPGNSTRSGRYMIHGKTIFLDCSITFGSTAVVSGTLFPNLPFPIVEQPVGPAWAFDSSATVWAVGAFAPSAYVLFGSGRASQAFPWTWSAGDILKCSLTAQLQ